MRAGSRLFLHSLAGRKTMTMPKEKISIGYRIGHWFTYHPWLKLIAFILAIMVWFYIKGEIKDIDY